MKHSIRIESALLLGFTVVCSHSVAFHNQNSKPKKDIVNNCYGHGNQQSKYNPAKFAIHELSYWFYHHSNTLLYIHVFSYKIFFGKNPKNLRSANYFWMDIVLLGIDKGNDRKGKSSLPQEVKVFNCKFVIITMFFTNWDEKSMQLVWLRLGK